MARKRMNPELDVVALGILAERGDPDAQTTLGCLCQLGQGVPRSLPEAVKWLRLAAAQGKAAARHNLGFMTQHGFGAPWNPAEAVKWYRLAASHGEMTHPRRTFPDWQHSPGGAEAVGALREVLRRPTHGANPLILTGGPGTGKSHLLRALVYEVGRLRPTRRVRFIRAEEISDPIFNEATLAPWADSIRHQWGNVDSLRDLLILDDAHVFWTFSGIRIALREIVATRVDRGIQVVLAGRWGEPWSSLPSTSSWRFDDKNRRPFQQVCSQQASPDDFRDFPDARVLRLSPLSEEGKAALLARRMDRAGVLLDEETTRRVSVLLMDDARQVLTTAARLTQWTLQHGKRRFGPEDVHSALPWTWFYPAEKSSGDGLSGSAMRDGRLGNRPGRATGTGSSRGISPAPNRNGPAGRAGRTTR